MSQRTLVTSALPYANGDIHLGHLVEYLQTDFWVRFQKMRGERCIYICADDTHGTPVMIRARNEGIQPEELIARSREAHLKDFEDFQIEFDRYGSTHSEHNRDLCSDIFKTMEEAGHVHEKVISQAYCEKCTMFLPDRFVKGTCPKCSAADQYGDSCDVCGATYSPVDMKDASCVECGDAPVKKDSKHVFFKLNDFKGFLEEWLPNHTPKEVANKVKEWFGEDLRDWDISREAPYFGFPIPGHEGQYFYVWVDAPMGYLSTTKAWCEEVGEDFEAWSKGDDTKMVHFIGKDIVYFHTLFWPAMLKCAGLNTPDQVYVHGFLTVNGEKMSKSKGTFIKARTFLDHVDPTYLRYYYASKLNSTLSDVDLSMDDLVQRVNSELINKITNLASRGAQMLGKRLDGKLGILEGDNLALVESAMAKGNLIAEHYQNRDFNRAIQEVRSISEEGNRLFEEEKPWVKIKEDPEGTRPVLTTVLHLFRICAIYLKPVLPTYAKKVEKLFREEPYVWADASRILSGHELAPFEHLLGRLEASDLEKVVEASVVEEGGDSHGESAEEFEPLADEISFDDLAKCDLRIGRIVSAEDVPKAGKLLRLKVDLGFETREILAGIKKAYKTEDLEGKLTLVAANLKPRKMKFGVSEGMVMAAGPGGDDIYLLSPDSGAAPGQRVM